MKASRHTIGSLAFPLSAPQLYASGFSYQPAAEQNGHPIVRALNLLRHPVVIALGGTGIFNLFPIAYSKWPRLRASTNPEWMNRSHGNLRFTANRNLTCFFVTYTNIFTSLIHHLSSRSGSYLLENAPLPLHPKMQAIASVIHLSPVRSSAQKHLTSELLRFL